MLSLLALSGSLIPTYNIAPCSRATLVNRIAADGVSALASKTQREQRSASQADQEADDFRDMVFEKHPTPPHHCMDGRMLTSFPVPNGIYLRFAAVPKPQRQRDPFSQQNAIVVASHGKFCKR
jgi:hypothetical protein